MARSTERIVLEGEHWVSVAMAAEQLSVSRTQVRRLASGVPAHGRRKAVSSCLRRREVGGIWFVALLDVQTYNRRRGVWNRGGVRGGLAAAERMGVQLRVPGTEVDDAAA